MSRIGKKPISLPKGVTVTVKDEMITVKGPKGQLNRKVPPHVSLEVSSDMVVVRPEREDRAISAFHGLARALLQNMVTGVVDGFKKEMSIVGVGYKVQAQGKKLVFSLGYSSPVEYELPQGIEAEVADKGVAFTLKGIDREALGQAAAIVRGFRPPEPYKGKGIRYAKEVVRQKAGKAGAK